MNQEMFCRMARWADSSRRYSICLFLVPFLLEEKLLVAFSSTKILIYLPVLISFFLSRDWLRLKVVPSGRSLHMARTGTSFNICMIPMRNMKNKSRLPVGRRRSLVDGDDYVGLCESPPTANSSSCSNSTMVSFATGGYAFCADNKEIVSF